MQLQDSLLPLSDYKNFIGLSSFEMLAMFRRGLFYAYLSIYLRQYLGLSVTETTLFATLPMTVNIFCQTFIWGRISDRFQVRSQTKQPAHNCRLCDYHRFINNRNFLVHVEYRLECFDIGCLRGQ